MSDLGNLWKQAAKSMIIAVTDLSVSVFSTVKAGVDYAVDWAKKDNPHVQTEAAEVAEEPVQEEAAEAQPEGEAQPESGE